MENEGRDVSGLRRRPCLVAVLALGLCAAAEAGGAGGGSGGGDEHGPARVENARPETDLAIVRLDPKAVERLGVRTVAVERRMAASTRTVGGVVMTPPGRAIQVAAPSEGTVLGVGGRDFPYPGTIVRRGDPLLRLLIVSANELAAARNVVQVASARAAIAEEAASAPAASAADLEELEAARAALAAANRRMRLMGGGGGAGAEGLAPITVVAPVDGVVRALDVSAGQAVPAGTPLLELVLTDPVWVRTPVYTGDLASIRSGADAQVRRLADPVSAARAATAVPGPPSANPDSASIDLYFSVANPDARLRPGERVAVTLTLGEDAPALGFPYAAVLYDIHGGAWVYERIEENAFARRRVEIAFVRDGLAVALRGPSEGAQIVTDGAAEIFGTEFGVGH